MKRFLALLLALLMTVSGALAENIGQPIATYVLPDGAEALHVWDSTAWEVPEGLDEMYLLMQTITEDGNVYLIRMPHGRAIASVSCTTPIQTHSAQEMLEMWPQIAQNIAKEGVAVDASESCASIEELYGFDALSIQTTIGLPGGMELAAAGAAFFRGEELLEIWTVAPVYETYAQDEQAAQQLTEDAASLAAFMMTLDFNPAASGVQSVPYSDPDGRFSLVIPEGCTVLTVHSTEDEIARAREAYLSVHPEGADAFFDEFITDVFTQRVVLFISEDQQIAAEIFASQEESFRGVTVQQLSQLGPSIQQSLAKKFEVALLLTADPDGAIGGREHAWLVYWLRNHKTNVQLDVLASVLEDAWLYEVDLYTHDGNQETRSLWFTFLTQTLQYTPLVNALDE